MASLGNLTQSQHPVLIYTPTTDHVSTDYPVTNLSATLRQPMDSHDSQLLHSLYFWLFGVLLCIVALIGISTNAINVYVLSITVKKNHRPMYHFLICMAVMDLLVGHRSCNDAAMRWTLLPPPYLSSFSTFRRLQHFICQNSGSELLLLAFYCSPVAHQLGLAELASNMTEF